MENNDKSKNKPGSKDKQNDCNCDDNCCQPKKKAFLPKLIFFVVLLAAAGIIMVKLFYQPAPAPVTGQQVFRDPNSPAWCDTSDSKTCDTTKGSSCCPK